MADSVTTKQCDGFGPEFVARFRGHKVAGGVSEPNLGVSASNFICGTTGYFMMRFIKRVLCKGTKFADFSVLGFMREELSSKGGN